MASIASACRLSARAVSRQLRPHGATRGFRTAPASLAAQNFTMPAMSPTMTEGNIASWKVKEGEAFSAGDVILEIETDKAQMDVEAQDDGILAKITVGDGSKAVKVGTRIAVLAEPGDDLSTLEIPREDTSAQSSKPAESQKEPTAQPPAAAGSQPRATTPAKPAEGSAAKTADSAGKAQKQKYPLYPSVLHLLKENGLSKEDADKIPASGPNGRLLKGDVLSYLGRIEQDYSAEQSKRIAKLGHLDLSNIKVVQPKKTQPTPPPTSAVEAPVEKPDTEIAIPISLEAVLAVQKRIQSTLGVHLPLETFIVRATDLANDALPRSKSAKPTQDELFNAILGLDKVSSTTSRGSFVPQITALPSVSTSPRAVKKPESDILDILAGKKSASARAPKVVPVVAAPVKPVFSVSVPKGDERRAKVFLERVKVVLEEEPGNLIL